MHMTQPLARGNDPITSFQAADSALDLIRTHERQIVYALRLHGAMGVDIIAFVAGLTPHATGKRMKALHEHGSVELTGRTVKSNSGRNQREWRAA